MTETEMLSEQEVAEIEARADAASPKPWSMTWNTSFGPAIWSHGDILVRCEARLKHSVVSEADPTPQWRKDMDFIRAAREDIPALCQTVRALRKELSEAYYESCEICDQEIVSGDGTKIHTFAVGGCCWNKSQETIAALRDQLAQSQAENERLASQLKEWQEDKDTKAGYL